MPYTLAVVITIVIIVTIFILTYCYEEITLPSIYIGASIFFAYVAIASQVYVMLVLPAFGIFYTILYIKSHPIHRKNKNKSKEKKKD